MVGDGRSGVSGAAQGTGHRADSWRAGAGQPEEMAKGDLESLSLEMFNNRGGSCHCCLGCGSARNQGAKRNGFFLNGRVRILKVKRSRSWWLRDSGRKLSRRRCPRPAAHGSALSTGPWTSADGSPQACRHLLFSTARPLPISGSVLLRLLATPRSVTVIESYPAF